MGMMWPGTVDAAPALETVRERDHLMPKGIRGKATCALDGCTDFAYGGGYCRFHFVRWKRHGDPTVSRPVGTNQPCSVAGCDWFGTVSRGMCQAHYRRWRKGREVEGPISRHPGGSLTRSNGYVRVTGSGHPLATGYRYVYQHRAVLFDAIGPGEHPCHWCGAMVSWFITDTGHPQCLTVDHLDWDRGNNDLANLVPSCWSCNVARQAA